jgi:hypothetical protein
MNRRKLGFALLPLLVLAAAISACASGSRSSIPSLESVRRSAFLENFTNESIVIERLELGAASTGSNTFRARVTNLTASPLQLGLDIRAIPGMWFSPAWQKQFTFPVPHGQAQIIEATYELGYVSPEAALRVRFAPAEIRPDGGIDLGEPLFERQYAVGYGNPAGMRFSDQWRQMRTEHFDIYARRGSLAERAMRRIGAGREAALREIARILDVEPDGRIRLVFYPDGETKRVETGHTGVGLARGTTLVEVFNAETQLDPYHELTHILARRLGNPPAMLNEGFATHISERLGASALKYLGHPGKRVEQVVCEHKASRELIPLAELVGYVEIGSEASRPTLAYPQAASIVHYLIATKGLEPFRQAYRELANSDDPERLQHNRQAWRNIFGESLEETEAAWLRSLDCLSRD